MQQLDLVWFLADSATEVLNPEVLNDINRDANLAEATELLNLSARILARAEINDFQNAIQEAA
jgi:hypothetical protein